MTPLAQRVLRQELEGRRGIFEGGLTVADLVQARCFDCVAVSEMARALSDDMHRRGAITKQVAFLPAPFTWIEFLMEPSPSGRTGGRAAFALQARADGLSANIFAATTTVVQNRPDLENKAHLMDVGRVWLGENAQEDGLSVPAVLAEDSGARAPEQRFVCLIYALLAIINTPRLIEQTDHAAHTGLQREVNRSNRLSGIELLKWTEVKLNVLDHAERREAGDTSGVLTGQRALHFCRSFIRIRLGRLELVKAHMRGNPDLGERRPVYIVGDHARTPILQPGQTGGQ